MEEPVDPYRNCIVISRNRWRLIGVAFAFVVLVGAWGIFKAYDNADNIASESVTREYNSCLAGNDGRKALKDVIVIATASGSFQLDLTKLPSYPTLTEETQNWIRELNAILNRPETPDDPDTPAEQLQKFSDENLLLRDCNAIRQASTGG